MVQINPTMMALQVNVIIFMQNKIKIIHVDINKIKPATYNPRVHDNEMLSQLEKSIKEFGLLDPVIVNSNPNRQGVLIGGHARYKIAKKLGYKKIPVVYTNLDLEQEKILNVKLNKISGIWDFSKLTELFKEDFLIDLGFEESELQSVWDETLESNDDGFNITEELKKIKTPSIKRGDLIILGKHKLLCSDSTDPDAVNPRACQWTWLGRLRPERHPERPCPPAFCPRRLAPRPPRVPAGHAGGAYRTGAPSPRPTS